MTANVRTIGFLGFGEAARAFCDTLAPRGGVAFVAHDRLLDRPEAAGAMRTAMEERDVRVADAPAGLAADWIVSAVTADQSLEAARALAPHLGPGTLFIDINSVSPDRKRETATLVTARGADYLDMAVMAPVHPRGHATPSLLAGPRAREMAGAMAGLGFSVEVAGDAVGAATGIKMVRSLFVKGLEAITVEALLAAQASGCFEEILASLSTSYPGLGWPQFAAYQFERTTRHGARRAAEMRESAATLDALGLNGALAGEIAKVQDRMALTGRVPEAEATLAQSVAQVLARRLADGLPPQG